MPLPPRAVAVVCAIVVAVAAGRVVAQEPAPEPPPAGDAGVEADAGAPTNADAEAKPPAETEPPAEAKSPGDASAEAEVKRPAVLFLMPAVDAQTQEELRDALLAQFALIEADVAFESAPSGPGLLGQRMADAQRRAVLYEAIAVFWIEEQPDGRWFVHMMDIERERIVVRPADAGGDRRISAIEAVAVMARESTRALIAGVPIPELAPAPPASAPSAAAPVPSLPPAPRAPPRQRPIRLSAGYLGTEFAEELPWRHGAAAGIGWFGFAPVYGGVSYVFTPALEVDADVDFELQRMPFAAHVGYRQRWDRSVLDVELGVVVEILHRSSLDAGATEGVRSEKAGTQAFSAVAPRLRGELEALPQLGVFATVGLDILINNFSYVVNEVSVDGTQERRQLRADDTRPVLELGVAFYP